MTNYIGTAGDDSYVGSFTYDDFDLSQGGNDAAKGASGTDSFTMGASLNTADRLDGGASNNDLVYLNGDYSAGLVLAPKTLVNIEGLYLYQGFSYDIRAADATNTTYLTVNGANLGAGEFVRFNGSRETTSTFFLYGGLGDDRLIGGGGGDTLYLNYGGHDVAYGGGGSDVFVLADKLDVADRVDGGDGRDFLTLDGDYNLVLKPNTVRFVERINFGDGHDYKLKLSDGTVAEGETLEFGAFLTGVHRSVINGSAELDGKLQIEGGTGHDIFVGGAADAILTGYAGKDELSGGGGDDLLNGDAGRDTMTGGAGQDTFIFRTGDTSNAQPDLITDLALADVIDLSWLDADSTADNDQAFTLVSHFNSVAGELDLDYDLAGDVTRVLMDTDGDGVADITILAAGNHAGFTQFIL